MTSVDLLGMSLLTEWQQREGSVSVMQPAPTDALATFVVTYLPRIQTNGRTYWDFGFEGGAFQLHELDMQVLERVLAMSRYDMPGQRFELHGASPSEGLAAVLLEHRRATIEAFVPVLVQMLQEVVEQNSLAPLEALVQSGPLVASVCWLAQSLAAKRADAEPRLNESAVNTLKGLLREGFEMSFGTPADGDVVIELWRGDEPSVMIRVDSIGGLAVVDDGQWLQAVLMEDTAVQMAETLVSVDNLVAFGHQDQAMAALQDALMAVPAHGAANLRLAKLLQDAGRMDEAFECFGHAWDDPDSDTSGAARFGLASIHFARGELEAAEKAFTAAIPLLDGSDRNAVRINVAMCRSFLGDREGGIHLLEELVADQPNFAFGWHALGLALVKLGRTEESIRATARAIALEPSAIAHYSIACAYALRGGEGDVTTLLTHVRAAVKSEPSMAQAMREDDDLASIRADARFEAALSGA